MCVLLACIVAFSGVPENIKDWHAKYKILQDNLFIYLFTVIYIAHFP